VQVVPQVWLEQLVARFALLELTAVAPPPSSAQIAQRVHSRLPLRAFVPHAPLDITVLAPVVPLAQSARVAWCHLLPPLSALLVLQAMALQRIRVNVSPAALEVTALRRQVSCALRALLELPLPQQLPHHALPACPARTPV
jgi:hypothetical protein